MTETAPAVSVVLTIYNRASLVPAAIESVLRQTYTDWELVCVDDGSTDGSPDVVRGFKDRRIRLVVHERNRGATAAMNTGIMASRAPYVLLLDSDDELVPHAISALVSVMDENPNKVENLGAVTFGLIIREAQGQERRGRIPRSRGWCQEAFFLNEYKMPVHFLVSRGKMIEAGLYDEALPASTKWDLGLRLSKLCQFDYVDDCLYIAKRHGGPRMRNVQSLVKAQPRLIEKHRELLEAHPRFYSRLLCGVASVNLKAGDGAAAGRAASEAVRRDPLSARSYLYWAMARIGPRGYGFAQAVHRRFAPRRKTAARRQAQPAASGEAVGVGARDKTAR